MDKERLKRSTSVTYVHGWVKMNLGESEASDLATKRSECLIGSRSTNEIDRRHMRLVSAAPPPEHGCAEFPGEAGAG